MTSAQKKRHRLPLRSGIAFIGLGSLDFFGNIRTDMDSCGKEVDLMLTDEFDHVS